MIVGSRDDSLEWRFEELSLSKIVSPIPQCVGSPSHRRGLHGLLTEARCWYCEFCYFLQKSPDLSLPFCIEWLCQEVETLVPYIGFAKIAIDQGCSHTPSHILTAYTCPTYVCISSTLVSNFEVQLDDRIRRWCRLRDQARSRGSRRRMRLQEGEIRP